MPIPVRSLVSSYPIDRVFQAFSPFKVFKLGMPSPPSEDFDLEEGKPYHFLAIQECSFTVNGVDYNLKAGWNYIYWREGIKFTPGKFLDQSWCDFAQKALKDTGLDKLLSILGVREVRVIPKEQYPYGSSATVWQSERAIVFKDEALMPASAFPALILHEAGHLWQMDMGYFYGSGTKAEELSAYMLSQIFHWLHGDNINVFTGTIYPAAKKELFEP